MLTCANQNLFLLLLYFSDGPLWQHNRRFALHTLRDFGVGKNVMEAKIMHQTEWLINEVSKSADTGCDYSIDDDLQMAVGKYDFKKLLSCFN